MSKKNRKWFIDIETSGFPVGNLTMIGGSCNPPKTDLLRFLPMKDSKDYMVIMPLESDKQIEQGVCILNRMLDKLEKGGFDVSEFKSDFKPRTSVTKYEKLGDTIYPVTYHNDGMVTVDYPDNLFCNRVKNKKDNG